MLRGAGHPLKVRAVLSFAQAGFGFEAGAVVSPMDSDADEELRAMIQAGAP